jgi:hypothetical protein
MMLQADVNNRYRPVASEISDRTAIQTLEADAGSSAIAAVGVWQT